jgi:two-component system sensor histidine kinase KdpD
MVFLAGVLFTAVWHGQRVAVVTAIAAFLVYNFYLVEPRVTLQFAGTQDLITILVFVAVALLTGRLAGQAHDARQQAESRAALFSRMFQISKSMADQRDSKSIGETLAKGVSDIVQDPVVFKPSDAKADAGHGALITFGSKPFTPPSLEAFNRASRSGRGLAIHDEADGERWELLGLGDAEDPAGAIAWRPLRARDAGALGAVPVLIELANATLASRHLARLQIELDARAANDRFRSALMSSLSHDFRTPLATILASATSLLDFDHAFDNATKRDLLTSIQEEVERINRFTANIFGMTRLEEGIVQPRLQWITPAEIVESAAERLKSRRPPFQVDVEIRTGDAVVYADPILLEQSLTNILDNAVVHANGASRVVIRAETSGPDVRFSVIDDGPGIDPAQTQRIFDKFYRLSTVAPSNKGSGLGLAIARGFIEAMNGRIEAASAEPSSRGLTVSIYLPGKAIEAMPA